MKWSDLTEQEVCQIKRKRLKLTLRQIANDLGVHFSYISKWENGALNTPNKAFAEKYRGFLEHHTNNERR